MYNLTESSSNYSDTARNLWFYSKNELTKFDNDIVKAGNFQSFKCKAKILGNTVAWTNLNQVNGFLKNTTITVPLKYLSNFWKLLEMLLFFVLFLFFVFFYQGFLHRHWRFTGHKGEGRRPSFIPLYHFYPLGNI